MYERVKPQGSPKFKREGQDSTRSGKAKATTLRLKLSRQVKYA